MSQKKVDNYKALKANRRNEQRKEKFYGNRCLCGSCSMDRIFRI